MPWVHFWGGCSSVGWGGRPATARLWVRSPLSPLGRCKLKCPWARHWTPRRITAAHCSLITKDGLNAENYFPLGINKVYILSYFRGLERTLLNHNFLITGQVCPLVSADVHLTARRPSVSGSSPSWIIAGLIVVIFRHRASHGNLAL